MTKKRPGVTLKLTKDEVNTVLRGLSSLCVTYAENYEKSLRKLDESPSGSADFAWHAKVAAQAEKGEHRLIDLMDKIKSQRSDGGEWSPPRSWRQSQ